MWYECLPTLAIITAAMSSYQFGSVFITKALLGRPNTREMDTVWYRVMFTRDERVVGNPLKVAGLENIPDD